MGAVSGLAVKPTLARPALSPVLQHPTSLGFLLAVEPCGLNQMNPRTARSDAVRLLIAARWLLGLQALPSCVVLRGRAL